MWNLECGTVSGGLPLPERSWVRATYYSLFTIHYSLFTPSGLCVAAGKGEISE